MSTRVIAYLSYLCVMSRLSKAEAIRRLVERGLKAKRMSSSTASKMVR